LPRNAQGKLPKAELLMLAKRALDGSAAGESRMLKGLSERSVRSI
jgi:hypothetical protein